MPKMTSFDNRHPPGAIYPKAYDPAALTRHTIGHEQDYGSKVVNPEFHRKMREKYVQPVMGPVPFAASTMREDAPTRMPKMRKCFRAPIPKKETLEITTSVEGGVGEEPRIVTQEYEEVVEGMDSEADDDGMYLITYLT